MKEEKPDGFDEYPLELETSYEHIKKDPFQQSQGLMFENPSTEDDYVRYMHPKPLVVIPIGTGLAALLFLQFVTQGIRGWNIEFYSLAVAFVFNVLIHIAFRCMTLSRAQLDLLLAAERSSITLLILIMLPNDVYFTMSYAQTCSTRAGIRITTLSKVHQDALCHRSWRTSPINALAVVIAATQFIRFPFMVGLCAYALALHMTMWVFVEPPDMLFNVWLYSIFVGASLAFIAFVRYDQEQVQRQQFVQSRRLVMEQERLAEQERSLAEFCSMLLPRSLLRRVGSFEATHTTDESSSGTALVVGIHDFGVWCTQSHPRGVAQGVVQLQSAVRSIATRHRLDFVGSVGDSVACVGNLSVVQRRAAWNTCAALLDVVQTVSSAAGDAGSGGELPPIRAAAHIGQLWGSFGHGCGGVRYDVYGPALETAFIVLLDCPAGQGLASLTLMDGAGASAEMLDVVSTVADENFIALESLHSRSERSASEAASTGTDGDAELLLDNLQLALKPLSLIAPPASESTVSDQPHVLSSPPVSTNDPAPNVTSKPLAFAEEAEEKLVPSELQAKLERYKQVRMVWCCFPRFVDDEVENAYVAERMEALPEAASRTWFAYGLYVLVILCLLLADMHEPNGVIGVVLLTLASLLSVAMGAVPKVLTREAMSRWYFVWSVVGVVLPLLVVYGCAVSRPSVVGNDASLYPVLGAFVRSYCFASSRWQAVIVPLMTVAGLFQYLLPGGYLNFVVFFMLLFVALVVVSEREREGAYRENARRKIERKLLLAQSRVEEALRDGLLRNTVPAPILPVVDAGLQRGGSRSHVLMAEGVTMVVRALSGSSSAKRFEALDAVLSHCRGILSMSGLLGDQAVVVGPVPRGFNASYRPDETEVDVAVKAAVLVGTKLAIGRSCLLPSNSSAPASPLEASSRKLLLSGGPGGDLRSFSVVMDVDDVVHTLEVGEFAQYWALGVSVTRLMAIVQGVDAGALFGCLATDRLVKRAAHSEIVSDSHVHSLGPMKVRGAGIVRLLRIDDPEDDTQPVPQS